MTSKKKELTDNTIEEKIAQASKRLAKVYGTGDMTPVDKNLASPKVQKLAGVDDVGRNLSQRPRQFSEKQIGYLGRGRAGSHVYDANEFLAASNTELSTHELPVHWNKIQNRLNSLESDVLSSSKLKEKLAEFKNTYAQSLADRDDPKFGVIAADLRNQLKLSTTSTGMFGRGDRVLGDDGKKVAIYLRELQRAIDEDVDGFHQWNQQLHEIENMQRRIHQLDLKNEEQKQEITRLETEKEKILSSQTSLLSEINKNERERSVSPQAVKSKNTTAKKSRASSPGKSSFGSAALAWVRKKRTIKQNPKDKVTISSGSSSEEDIDFWGGGGYKRRRKTRRKRNKHKKRKKTRRKRKKRKKTRQRKRCTKKRLRKKMICVKGAKKKLKKLRAYTKKIKLNLTRCSKKRMKKWTLKKK